MFLFIQPNPPLGRLQFTLGVEQQGLKGRNQTPDQLRSEPQGPANTPGKKKTSWEKKRSCFLYPSPKPSLLPPEKTTPLHWPR